MEEFEVTLDVLRATRTRDTAKGHSETWVFTGNSIPAYRHYPSFSALMREEDGPGTQEVERRLFVLTDSFPTVQRDYRLRVTHQQGTALTSSEFYHVAGVRPYPNMADPDEIQIDAERIT